VTVRIVDPETCKAAPAGTVGEVWVGGDLVAQGYWNRAAETEATFRAEIKGEEGKYLMRTGDVGFMSDDDELVFTGRRKDLIIVEGKNHYPQDIEKTVESSQPEIRPGNSIAFSLEEDGQVRVVVVAELNKEYRLAEIAAGPDDKRIPVSHKEIEKAIRREVAEEHQLRVHEVVLNPSGAIPKTTSGKLQRSGCRQKFLAGTLPQCN
jgi:acyl-CoA synthetase (AMP-forming)/AMP-acid ligase II